MEANAFGSDADMFATTKRCQAEAGAPSDPSKKESKEFEDMLGDEFNLVWKALSKGVGGDNDFKALMMSVSGTIISKKGDEDFILFINPHCCKIKNY